MRTLSFQPNDRRRYKIIHQTLALSALPLVRNELLSYGRLLEAIEGIGVRSPRATEVSEDAVVILSLAEVGGAVPIDEHQYSLLRKHLAKAIGGFPKPWSVDVNATAEWLDTLAESPAVAG